MLLARRMFNGGVLAVLPMLPGVTPFGVVAGLTAVESGLSPLQAMAMSLTIFAGASQLATAQLMAQGAAPFIILLTALTINLRFAMYSASLAPHLQYLPQHWRWPLAYFLVDQNYALTIQALTRADARWRQHSHWFYLGAGAALWLTWQAATAVGAFMASSVPSGWSLDFAIPLVFLVLLLPALITPAHMAAAVAGGLVATLAASLPLHLGVVTGAVAGIITGVLVDRWSASQ